MSMQPAHSSAQQAPLDVQIGLFGQLSADWCPTLASANWSVHTKPSGMLSEYEEMPFLVAVVIRYV